MVVVFAEILGTVGALPDIATVILLTLVVFPHELLRTTVYVPAALAV